MKLSIALALFSLSIGVRPAFAQAPLFFQLPAGYYPTDVSTAGGNVTVVGTSFNSGGAFKWTPTGGVVEIGSTSYNDGEPVRISRDGTTIVGSQDVLGTSSAAIENGTVSWTPIPGIGGSSSGTSTTPSAVNSNGTVITGLGWVNGGTAHAYKWTQGSGSIDLMPFFNSPSSRAFGVNGDGTVTVGWEDSGGRKAARWVGTTRTFLLYNGVIQANEAYAVNALGTIVVGYRLNSNLAAWRWDSATNNITPLPNLPGYTTHALAIDLVDDGSKIIGTDGGNVFTGIHSIIWINDVPQALNSYLISLGMSGSGGFSDLGYPEAISPEGGAIVGRGYGAGQPAGWVVIYPQFLPNGTAYCAGDGSAAACPCGNSSPVGDNAGCLSSIALGGKLRGAGTSSVAADSVTLTSTQVPNGPALYFQGDAQSAGGAGFAFGDGLLCSGGVIIRLGVKFASGNTSTYPGAGDPLLSIQGGVVPGDVRHYQAWYRDAFTFCTPAFFNLTNGVSVTWTN